MTSMLWTTAVSVAITNTGLPKSALIGFAFALGGLSIGWISIVLHNSYTDQAARGVVDERIQKHLEAVLQQKEDPQKTTPPELPRMDQLWQEARLQVVNSKTFVQRFFSAKALHGGLFFVSWFQICGRMFASDKSLEEFTCHTYPVYKPIHTREGDYTNVNITLVPNEDPEYERLPWANNEVGWALTTVFGSLAVAIVGGALWSFLAARSAAKRAHDEKLLAQDVPKGDGDCCAAMEKPDSLPGSAVPVEEQAA